jgi:hypothetical protein
MPPGTGFLFVAFFDSRGYGGGIRTRVHAGKPGKQGIIKVLLVLTAIAD